MAGEYEGVVADGGEATYGYGEGERAWETTVQFLHGVAEPSFRAGSAVSLAGIVCAYLFRIIRV